MKLKKYALTLLAVACIILPATIAPLLPLADPLAMDLAKRFALASFDAPLGNDEYGRSVISRLIWGMHISLIVAVCSSAIGCVVGTALGILAAYLRGLAETAIMRFMDMLVCLPALLVAMVYVTLYGPGAGSLIPILAVVSLPAFTRVAYSAVLTVRSQEYVEASHAMGASRLRTMVRTILPNISSAVLVQLSLATASAVVLESGLSFLGLGIVPPDASLGTMIGSARSTLVQAPQLLLWPCAALTLLILTLNAVCDLLRDLLDPRHVGSS